MGVFGLDGTLKITPLTDFPERFKPKATLYIDQQPYKIRKSHWHKDQVRVTLHAIDRIEEAQPFIGKRVHVPISDRPELEANEFFAIDLVGMMVVDERGNEVGKVTDIVSAPAQDIIAIGDMLVPMVKEFVLDVDLDARQITVKLLDGMQPGAESE